MWPEESLARVSLVKSETERLSALWRGFSEEEWKTDTFCPGWTAETAVSHVITGGPFYGNSVQRALDGLPPEPPYGKDGKEFWAIRKEKGEELKKLPRGEMMDVFDSTSAALQESLGRITSGDLDKPGYHPRGLAPVQSWIGMRLVELVVHDWDIKQGKDPASRVVPPGVEGMIVFVPGFLVRLFNSREVPPFEGRFHFRSDDLGREWTLSAGGGKAEVSSDVSGDCDAVITADGEAHLLLPYGRLTREAAESEGRLRIEGNAAAADRLLGALYTKY